MSFIESLIAAKAAAGIAGAGSGGGYTDQVPVSTDADGSVFNGTGYQNDSYISSGTGGVSSQAGYVVTGFIPYAEGDVIRFKGAIWGEGSYSRIAFYDADKNKILVGTYPSSGEVADEGNGVYRLTPSVAEGGGKAYVRLSFYGTGENLVVTINEKIVSAVADWNTMKNKPFGEENTIATVVPKQTLTFAMNQLTGAPTGFLDEVPSVEVGKTYTVIWNGDTYPCTAFTFEFRGYPGVAFGNTSFVGGANTGEPFLALTVPSEGLSGFVTSSEGDNEVSVETENVIVKTIDPKYVDAEWMATKSVEKDVVLLEGAIEKLSTNGHAFSGFGPEDVVASGGAVTVTWNGTEYACPLREAIYNGAKMAWIGNCYEHPLLGRFFGSDTGEPFLFGFGITNPDGSVNEGCMINAVNSSGESAEFTIKGNRLVPNQMPEEFLPNNVFAPSFNLALAGFPNIPRDGGSVSAKLDVTKDIIQALQKGPVWITANITFGEYINEVTMLIFATRHGSAGLGETHAWGIFESTHFVGFKFEYSDAWDGTWTTTAWGATFATKADLEAARPYVILNSSTKGSTKQFKVTVDDSGTLSATEVTEG